VISTIVGMINGVVCVFFSQFLDSQIIIAAVEITSED